MDALPLEPVAGVGHIDFHRDVNEGRELTSPSLETHASPQSLPRPSHIVGVLGDNVPPPLDHSASVCCFGENIQVVGCPCRITRSTKIGAKTYDQTCRPSYSPPTRFEAFEDVAPSSESR
jgi:hypothetical protein